MDLSKFPFQHIGVLIMPTDSCNMNCVYCFNGRRKDGDQKVMSEETLTRIFDIVIPYYSDIRFVWHGGEPLLMGKAFYENALRLQEKANVNGACIVNSVQTNLSLMDSELAEFFVKNEFRIGSSFDGCTNEMTRHNSQRILDGHKTLKNAGGHNGFICVVQKNNIDHLIEDYEWFKENDVGYSLNQYLTSPPYENDPLFVPEEQYINRVCEFFDYWMYDTTCNIRVSYFDYLLKYILLNIKELCTYNSCMGKHIGVHYDGKIYGCNRDFPEEYCFGSVFDYSDIRECFESKGFQSLLSAAITRRTRCREKCELYDFCTGGCNSCAIEGGDIFKPNEYVCSTTIPVYKYIKESVEPWRNTSHEERVSKLNPFLVRLFEDCEGNEFKDLNRE